MGKTKNADDELNIYLNINIAFKHYNEVKALIAERKEENEDISPEIEVDGEMDVEMEIAKKDLYETRMAIAGRLDDLIHNTGIKHNYLAKLLNTSEQNFSRIMNAGADLSTGQIVELSRIFGVSADYILFGEKNTARDEDVYEILKDKSYSQKKRAAKLLKVHFGME